VDNPGPICLVMVVQLLNTAACAAQDREREQ